ncbi:MAG: cell envelope integrity protein TolA [Pseudomonadales bacterium]
MNWEGDPTIQLVPDERYYIEASVVRQNPHEAKEREKKATQQVQAARQKEAQARQAADRRRKEAMKQEQAEREQAEREQRQKETQMPELAEIPKLDEIDQETEKSDPVKEAERKRMEENLVNEIMEEQEYRRAITADEKAMAYVAQIKRQIAQNWSRPPSARRDMEAMLRVRLVPTGEVVNVSVVKSSGNSAFDRSAVLAVEKADRFQVPNDSSQFERNFREFNVLFRPEDLRL